MARGGYDTASFVAGTRGHETMLYHTGVTRRIRYEVQPVDDMERLAGPPYWLDLEDCRYYISQRVAPDPETRKIWEHNEAEAAIVQLRRPVMSMRLVATSRCRGWSLFRFRGRSDGVDHTGGRSSVSRASRSRQP